MFENPTLSPWKQVFAVLLGTLPITASFYTHSKLRSAGWKNGSSAAVTGGVLAGTSVLAYIVKQTFLVPSMGEYYGMKDALKNASGQLGGLYLPLDGGLPRSSNRYFS